MIESLLQHYEEVFDILHVDGSQSTQTEGVGRTDLTRINGKATVIAIVVYLLETPVGIIGVLDRHHQT